MYPGTTVWRVPGTADAVVCSYDSAALKQFAASSTGKKTNASLNFEPVSVQGKSQLLPPAPPYYAERSLPGVIYGVLLWADMNTATPLGAWGRSVISLAVPANYTLFMLKTAGDMKKAGDNPGVAAVRNCCL